MIRASINSNLHMCIRASWKLTLDSTWICLIWNGERGFVHEMGANVFLGRRLIIQGLCMRRRTESASSLCQLNPSKQDQEASKENKSPNMRACWYSSWHRWEVKVPQASENSRQSAMPKGIPSSISLCFVAVRALTLYTTKKSKFPPRHMMKLHK